MAMTDFWLMVMMQKAIKSITHSLTIRQIIYEIITFLEYIKKTEISEQLNTSLNSKKRHIQNDLNHKQSPAQGKGDRREIHKPVKRTKLNFYKVTKNIYN